MNIGAFAVDHALLAARREVSRSRRSGGLGWKQPSPRRCLPIFLLSLIGVPLTGGFFGKFYIFKAALDANLICFLCWAVNTLWRRTIICGSSS